VIRSFADKRTAALFAGHVVKRLARPVQERTRGKLQMIDAARRLGDLWVPPGNRLDRLRGDRAGQHSIRVNDRWRICFVWRGGDAWDVEMVDYHKG
jgi:proteic killer suppression protein